MDGKSTIVNNGARRFEKESTSHIHNPAAWKTIVQTFLRQCRIITPFPHQCTPGQHTEHRIEGDQQKYQSCQWCKQRVARVDPKASQPDPQAKRLCEIGQQYYSK